MKKLNWENENLRWMDTPNNERAEVLESKVNDELTYSEIENLYNNEFYLADEEGYALDLDDINEKIIIPYDEFEEKLSDDSKEVIENKFKTYKDAYDTFIEGWNLSYRDKEATEFYSNPNNYFKNLNF